MVDLADLERKYEQWWQDICDGLTPEDAEMLRHLREAGERASEELGDFKRQRRVDARRPAILYLGWPQCGESLVLRREYVDVQLTAPETSIMRAFAEKGWPKRVPKARIGANGSGRTPWVSIRKKLPDLIDSRRGNGGGVRLTERLVVVQGA